MAKLSSINKNERRKKLVKKYAGRYARLKAIANDESKDETERLIARLKLAEIPRNGNPTRVRNRCDWASNTKQNARPEHTASPRRWRLSRCSRLMSCEGEPSSRRSSRRNRSRISRLSRVAIATTKQLTV